MDQVDTKSRYLHLALHDVEATGWPYNVDCDEGQPANGE
jgi:hypothetical protein